MADQPFAAADSHLSQADLACLTQRVANDDIAFAGQLVGGRDEVGPLEVAVVDVLGIDELHKVHRLLALELDRVDLLGLERDVGVGVRPRSP